MAQFTRPARKMNALSEYKTWLLAEPQQGAKKRPTLRVDVYNNNPRLIVRTNVPNDKDYGRITAAMNGLVFSTFLQMLREIADGPANEKLVLNNTTMFAGNKRLDTPMVINKVIVGKDQEGIVYLAVTAKDRPMIKFQLLPDEFHFLANADGTPLEKSKVSVLYAKGWANRYSELVTMVEYNEYVEPELPNRSEGGNNRNQGGGSNNNRQSSSDDSDSQGDDDLPF